MIHPAFIAIAKRPSLLLEHADAYTDLASAELDELSLRWKQRAAISVAATVMVTLGLFLGGAAGLLLAAIPLQDMPRPWLLWAIPGLTLLTGAGLAWTAHSMEKTVPFSALRQQMAQDLATLKILDEE